MLFGGFYVFGDDIQVEFGGQFDDVVENMFGKGIDVDVGDEVLVDFQVVYLEFVQVGQVGMFGVEIVDGDFYFQGM